MPAKTEKQRRFFGAVKAAKEGKLKNPSGAVKKAAEDMTKDQVDDFVKTRDEDLSEGGKLVAESLDEFVSESPFDRPYTPSGALEVIDDEEEDWGDQEDETGADAQIYTNADRSHTNNGAV